MENGRGTRFDWLGFRLTSLKLTLTVKDNVNKPRRDPFFHP